MGAGVEKAMAPHSSTLAWRIPWMEEPGRLQSMGSLRVGHDFTFTFSLSCIGEGNGDPLQCSCLENPKGRGAWWAAVYGVAQSRTRLKWLSSSSSSNSFRVYGGWGGVYTCFVWFPKLQIKHLKKYSPILASWGQNFCKVFLSGCCRRT